MKMENGYINRNLWTSLILELFLNYISGYINHFFSVQAITSYVERVIIASGRMQQYFVSDRNAFHSNNPGRH